MAKLSSLMDYYYESMYPELKLLEEERLRIISKLKTVAMILAIIGAVTSFILLQMTTFSPLQAIGLSVAMSGLLFLFVYQHEKAGYDVLFKDNVIEKIIHFIEPTFSYRSSSHISEAEYRLSGLLPQNYDRFSGSDLVEGVREGVSLHFSDLLVEEKHQGKNGKEEWRTLFQGLFFCADFHKHFKGKTYVLPDIAERSLGFVGSLLQELNRSHGKLMKLDHVEFEKYFVVYGDDPVETRYILSPAFMERIVAFYTKKKKNLSIGFVAGKMYLALEYKKALFAPSLSTSVLAFADIKAYFELLEMVFGIVEAFKLDQKLWGKY